MGRWKMNFGYTARVIRSNEHDDEGLPLSFTGRTVAATKIIEAIQSP